MPTRHIFVVEIYWDDYINEDVIQIPMRAFTTMELAEDFATKCEEEKQRIDNALQVYWMEYTPEYQALTKEIRALLMRRENMLESSAHKRQEEIMNASKKIEASHKYHPDLHVYKDMDMHYEITTLELHDERYNVQSNNEDD